MARLTVGVLRGGTSSEYNLSLKSGAAIISALSDEKYDVRDILVDKTGMWHLRGFPADAARILSQIDVVINAMHGGVGEDGSVQRILDQSGVAYTGSSALSSGLALNKVRAREILQKAGVRMPRGASFSLNNDLNTGEMAHAVFQQFGPPYIIKPPSEGASSGIRYASNFNELPDALGDVIDAHGAALVEEFVRGYEATVGIIEKYRGEDLYALPPAHVTYPEGSRHIEHSHHHEGLISHTVPSAFEHHQKDGLIEAARAAHAALGLSHYSRSDFIITPRATYLLEVNAIPGLYKEAAFPQMLEAVGSSVPEFLDHAVQLAYSK